MNEVHVLNGDALLYQFPEAVIGEKLVMRECLIEGPIGHTSFESFFEQRMAFLQMRYGATNISYKEKTVSQFEQLRLLSENIEINLWFEQDLFCQTNLWFVCYYLLSHQKTNPIYLIMPEKFSNYGFGGLSKEDLYTLYRNKKPFNQLLEYAELWKLYSLDQDQDLLKLAIDLSEKQPYLLKTVKAHLDRKRTGDFLGRPTKSLIKIIHDLKTTDFGKVFKEFCVREGIYGFGDSQVKILFDEIIDNDLHQIK